MIFDKILYALVSFLALVLLALAWYVMELPFLLVAVIFMAGLAGAGHLGSKLFDPHRSSDKSIAPALLLVGVVLVFLIMSVTKGERSKYLQDGPVIDSNIEQYQPEEVYPDEQIAAPENVYVDEDTVVPEDIYVDGDIIAPEDMYFDEDVSASDEPFAEDEYQFAEDEEIVELHPVEGADYSLVDLPNLNGFFSMNKEKQTLTSLNPPIEDTYVNWYGDDDEADYIGFGDFLPTVIDRSNGELLIAVGDAGTGVGKGAECTPVNLVGYTNLYMLLETRLENLETIANIDISTVNEDLAATNAAISGTPFSVTEYSVGAPIPTRLNLYLSDTYKETFTYGYFEGTEYIETNVAMLSPFYTYSMSADIDVPVQKTMDGYFIIDISSLNPGYYWLDNGSVDFHPFLVK